MKELSIQEKATRYDEALKEVVIAHKDEDRHLKATLERIFPELKESEDDRMVKFIKNQLFNIKKIITENYELDAKLTKAICWLEKQCEQKIKTPEESLGIDSDTYNKIVDECIYGEQKPIDKVESNFKVGDWVVYCNDDVDLITGIEENGYCINNSGYIQFICASDIRLWTIQDAKDGDVLHSTGWHNDCIFIFNRLDNWKFDKQNGDRAVATGYCCLSISADKMEFCIQGPDCVEVNTIKPATKIQHDLLFKKMKEAGYEWDAEKKELKEIEPAEWSEECCINQLIVFCENCMVQDSNAKKCASFLKSLKERYTWKPSEEQMNTLEYYMHTLICNEHKEVLFGLYEDLKKLREE